MQRHCKQYTHSNHHHGNHIKRKTTLAECREKTGTNLQTDRIDKKNEAELLNKMQQVSIYIETQTTEHNTYKKYPRYTKRDTGNLNLAEHHTYCNNQCQNQHRVGNTTAPLGRIADKHILQKFYHNFILISERKSSTINKRVKDFSIDNTDGIHRKKE